MSPFKSTKLGILSNSVKYILDRDDRVGAAITTTSTNHVWSYGDYNYICFLSPGTFTVQRSGKVDYCLVGGGGGGGGGLQGPPFTGADGGGGGGGAGGVIHNYNYDTAEGTYTVVIGGGGAGGAGGSIGDGHGVYGTPTTITGPGITPTEYFTAYGGGGGGSVDQTAPFASSDVMRVHGASGGGVKFATIGNGNVVSNPPSWPTVTPLAPYRPDGIQQGFNGGVGLDGDSGGGGGGASEVGGDSPLPSIGGFGGNGIRVFAGDAGLEPANTPAPLVIGQAADPGLSLLPGRYVGGGGGGGGVGGSYTVDRPAGGGGMQGPGYSIIYMAAIDNTGSGGAGGAEQMPPGGPTSGGAGASGIVIIRYKRVVDGG